MYLKSTPAFSIASVIKKQVSKFIDLTFFLKFVALLIILYYGNLAFIAIIDTNGKVYSELLDTHLNYINWLRNSYLYAGNAIANSIGLHSNVSLPYRISSANGSYVEMVYECLGIGLLSFWTAFIWANNGTIKHRLSWWLTGIFFIWMINCFRIAILLKALDRRWAYNAYMNHHTLFNIIAYILIIILIVFFEKSRKKIPANP